MRLITTLTRCLLLLIPLTIMAEDSDADAIVQRVVFAAGGEAKLFRLFKITKQLNVSSDPDKKPNERVSVLEPPEHWWLGRKDRVQADKEPATYLVWAGTLGAVGLQGRSHSGDCGIRESYCGPADQRNSQSTDGSVLRSRIVATASD